MALIMKLNVISAKIQCKKNLPVYHKEESPTRFVHQPSSNTSGNNLKQFTNCYNNADMVFIFKCMEENAESFTACLMRNFT